MVWRAVVGRWLLWIVCLGLALSAPRAALADQAQEKFAAGRAAMEAGQYDRACQLFKESLDLGAPVGALLNLAACEDKRGHLARSLALWREGLAKLPEADPRVDLARRGVEDVGARVGRIAIVWPDAPPGAKGYVDATDAVIGGDPVLVDPGAHKITTSSPTSGSRTVDVVVGSGELKTVDVATSASLKPTPPEARGSGLLVGGLTAFGVAGAAVVGAIVSGVVYLDERATLDEVCPDRGSCTDPDGIAASDTGRAAGAANVAMFVIGGAAAALGTTLVVVHVTSGKRPGQPTAAIVWRGAGAALVGTF